MDIDNFLAKASKRIKKNSSVKEEDIEGHFKKYAKNRGCAALKLFLLSKKGFPDRTVLCPGGRIFFLEFKKKGKGATTPQLKVKKMLIRLGFNWYLCDGIGQAEKILDDILEDDLL